jgi:PleD family two-component response regulator
MLATGLDVSEGGLYVHTGRSFRSDRLHLVTIPLHNGMKISVRAKVRHNQPGIGMGLMFVDLNDEQKAAIKALVEGLEPGKSAAKVKRILLIEDEGMSRRMRKSKLVLEGFEVIEAKEREETLDLLDEERPDLVILDLHVKQMDGFNILSSIRESPEWRDIPVIVLSGQSAQDIVERAMHAGADEFLAKMTTSPVKLADTVKAVLSRKPGTIGSEIPAT